MGQTLQKQKLCLGLCLFYKTYKLLKKARQNKNIIFVCPINL